MAMFVGIEGVGMRQSLAVAADGRGKILSAVRRPQGISLHTTPRDELRSRITYLLRDLVIDMRESIHCFDGSTICIGLTGVTFPYDACVDLPREFDELGLNVNRLICTGDAEIVFASHTQSSSGGAILCHMGSTGYVAFRGKHKRFGGWGPALGDEGSGYWIGRAALRAIGEEHDLAESEPSVLWREIQGWLQSPDDPNVEEWSDASRRWRQKLEETQAKGFDPRTAVFAFAHDVSRESTWLWRIVVSSLTIPVMRAWKKGDKKADQIVQQAAQELWHQFEMARSIAGAPIGHGPVVLYGGVLTHNPEFRRLVSELVYSGNGNSTEIVLPSTEKAMRPVCGALLFAIGGSKTGNLCLPEHDIVDRLLADVAGTRYDAILRND